MRYFFGDHQLDTERCELKRGDSPVALEPQVFDLLVCLLQNRDRVLSKNDLLARVWGGRIVSDATIDSRIKAARRAIGDSGEEQRLIRTAVGRGVRFVGTVQEQHADRESVVTLLGSPRLSVVVLPFADFSDDSGLEHFADGLTDDLTTELARASGAFVIARNTAFAFKGRSVAVTTIGQELGVHYVVEGSVRLTGDRARVNLQLTDAEKGVHLWADRFEIDPVQGGEMQNEILGRLARNRKYKLLEAAGRRLEREKVRDLDPQDLFIYGAAKLRASSAAGLQEALRAFERLLEIDPSSAAAKWGIGYALCINVANFWSTSVQQDLARAEPMLLQVIEKDPNLARGRMVLGLLRTLQNRLDESRIELETAIDLDPNFATSFWLLSGTFLYLAQPDAAIVEIEKGLRLIPSGEAVPIVHTRLCQCHLLSGRTDQGLEAAKKARADNPRLYFVHALLAAALGLTGEINEARTALAEAIKLRPDINSEARLRAYMTWGSPRYWALREKTIALGLRRAGMTAR